MVLTTLIIPPTALLVMTTVFDSPFEERLEARLQEKLQSGEISEKEYQDIKNKVLSDRGKISFFLRPPQLTIFVISLFWLGVGIRQWLVLSKWDKKYQRFKKKQDEADKELGDNSDIDDNKSHKKDSEE
jgi:uncharacterized membrane protein